MKKKKNFERKFFKQKSENQSNEANQMKIIAKTERQKRLIKLYYVQVFVMFLMHT